MLPQLSSLHPAHAMKVVLEEWKGMGKDKKGKWKEVARSKMEKMREVVDLEKENVNVE
jgi:hypothetical protein